MRDLSVEEGVRIFLTGGMAMGIMSGLTYEEGTISLEAGDTLFLYTDGISEAMDMEGREFTVERLLESLGASHRQSLDIVVTSVTDAVSRFVGDAPQHDDMTYLVVRYKGSPDTIDSGNMGVLQHSAAAA
ncbi:MAG: hypothetical protein B7Z14_03960 [Bosea sp. 32-68-6]|nr:MAG: hypothetical protein B7Z14_03960 [Bosea sp. 32-68-6]